MENEIKPYFEHKLKTNSSKAEMQHFARETAEYLICLSMHAETENGLQDDVSSLAELKKKYADKLHLINMVNNQIDQSQSLPLTEEQIKIALSKLFKK